MKILAKSNINLKDYELDLLEDGNRYSLAHLILDFYPDICGKANFTFHDAVNNYKARIDYDDGIYTLWGDDGTKYFFDTELKLVGIEPY